MRSLIVALLVVPALALGADKEAAGTGSANPMADWVPPKVKSEAKDKKEITTLLNGFDTAARTGDVDAAAVLVDFPVTMMTDDSKGQGMADSWDRERWTEAMKPTFGGAMKDTKVTHKPNIFLLSDSLAVVDDVATMTQGGKTITSRSSMFVLRKDGVWRVKAMAEGGWGDMMGQAQGSATAPQEPSRQGTDTAGGAPPSTGSTGTGTGAGTGTGSQSPPEKTTK